MEFGDVADPTHGRPNENVPIRDDVHGWLCWTGERWLRWDGSQWQDLGVKEPTTTISPQQVFAHQAFQPSDAIPVPSGTLQSTGYSSPSLFMLTGAACVILGSFMPFITVSVDGQQLTGLYASVNPVGIGASRVFGLWLLLASAPSYYVKARKASGIISLVLAVIILAVYVVWTISGLVGVENADLFGARESWTPNIGLLLSILGCALAAFGAIKLLSANRKNITRGP